MLKYIHKVIPINSLSPEELELRLDSLSDDDWTPLGMSETVVILRKLSGANYGDRMRGKLNERDSIN